MIKAWCITAIIAHIRRLFRSQVDWSSVKLNGHQAGMYRLSHRGQQVSAIRGIKNNLTYSDLRLCRDSTNYIMIQFSEIVSRGYH